MTDRPADLPDDFNGPPREAFVRNAQHITGHTFLQLGALSGDATLWLHKRFPDALIIDVDTWRGSIGDPGHEQRDWDAIRAGHHARCAEACVWYEGTTDDFFADQRTTRATFDFVYIDADHRADSVVADAANALARLRVGGVIAFDDYDYQPTWARGDVPRPAIDAFLFAYADRIEVLEHGPRQVWIRKVKA